MRASARRTCRLRAAEGKGHVARADGEAALAEEVPVAIAEAVQLGPASLAREDVSECRGGGLPQPMLAFVTSTWDQHGTLARRCRVHTRANVPKAGAVLLHSLVLHCSFGIVRTSTEYNTR